MGDRVLPTLWEAAMLAGRLDAAGNLVISATYVILATKLLEVSLLGRQTENRICTNKLVVIEQEGCWKGSRVVVSFDKAFQRSSQVFEL